VNRGYRVTVLEREPEQRNGCSFGNAGMIVPSHFVPLAAPGMVALGLKWMWNPESPFYLKPRLDWELMRWAFQFWQAANAGHVQRAAPLLRDLSLASRACFEELADLAETDFGLVKKGLVMLCKTPHTLEEEAKTAATHAALGARDPNNLDAMKLHAGHVLNALDPTIVATGPGKGYGAKRAALGVASHIDLAAKAPGASQNVITHAVHIGTAARSAAARADQVIALARQIQAATTAVEAAKLYSQMVPLAQQVYEGFDANSDGRIGWQEGEGGLAQAEQHVTLMLNGEVIR
jgi:glycine/D-amino acid oxidase-like deaminating enzyme